MFLWTQFSNSSFCERKIKKGGFLDTGLCELYGSFILSGVGPLKKIRDHVITQCRKQYINFVSTKNLKNVIKKHRRNGPYNS